MNQSTHFLYIVDATPLLKIERARVSHPVGYGYNAKNYRTQDPYELFRNLGAFHEKRRDTDF